MLLKGVSTIVGVVIPARNEAYRITSLLKALETLPLAMIIPVLNGCQDQTFSRVASLKNPNLRLIYFEEALGIDVPRVIGAAYALSKGASAVIFVDGDMTGNLADTFHQIISSLERGTDLALTNCYPKITRYHDNTFDVLEIRRALNKKLGQFPNLGLATPSHGPHGCSRRLLENVPLIELAIPPVVLPLALQQDCKVAVAAAIAHPLLGSANRSTRHHAMITGTLLGDHAEAISVCDHAPRTRVWQGILRTGYHPFRRFDLIYSVLTGKRAVPVWIPGRTNQRLEWWFGC